MMGKVIDAKGTLYWKSAVPKYNILITSAPFSSVTSPISSGTDMSIINLAKLGNAQERAAFSGPQGPFNLFTNSPVQLFKLAGTDKDKEISKI